MRLRNLITEMWFEFRTRMIIGAVLAVPCAAITFMTLDNRPPYEYDVDNSYIVPSQTQAGKQITVHWKFSRINRICTGTSQRIITDVLSGARITFDVVLNADDVKLTDDHLDRTFFLPQNISPGEKLYRVELEFVCNPLHAVSPLHVTTPTIRFTVLEDQ